MKEDLEQFEKEAFATKKVDPAEKKQQQEEKEKGKRLMKEIFSWIQVIVVSLVLAWFIGNYVIMNAYIPSSSMEDTLKEEDKVIGLRFAYLFSEPERGDIVMFKYPDDESKDYIKRVIGLPGETVKIKGGLVYINDSEIPLEEDYLKETPLGDFGPFEVPEGSYFVMGDNRNQSWDSRYWNHTFVAKDKILAKAVLKWYPKITLLD